MSDTKNCIGCGKDFHRPYRKNDPRLLSITVWRRTIYCSRQCAASHPPHREKLRQSAIAAGNGKWMKGKKASDECRRKISDSLIGHKRNVGKSPSAETRRLLSEARKGEKSHLWRGGRTSENALIRSSIDYRAWRKSVFERDNYTCVGCGAHGVQFHADHIKPFALFPELRFEVSNGRTLCVACHKATPTYLKSGRQLVEAIYPAVRIMEI